MTHEYDDPVTEEIVAMSVTIAARLWGERGDVELAALAREAVDEAFCTCVTTAADASIGGRRSPVHAGLIAEVVRRTRLRGPTAPENRRDPVDLASELSVPASDPPAWIWHR